MARLGLPELDVLVARGLERISKNPVRWALYTFLAGLLFGGVTFSLIEPKTSIPDGMWWAFVSMTTVGYGDISPKSDIERFLATFVIACGVFSLAILTASLAGRITQKRIEHAHETPELDDDVDAIIEQLNQLKLRLTDQQREIVQLQKGR